MRRLIHIIAVVLTAITSTASAAQGPATYRNVPIFVTLSVRRNFLSGLAFTQEEEVTSRYPTRLEYGVCPKDDRLPLGWLSSSKSDFTSWITWSARCQRIERDAEITPQFTLLWKLSSPSHAQHILPFSTRKEFESSDPANYRRSKKHLFSLSQFPKQFTLVLDYRNLAMDDTMYIPGERRTDHTYRGILPLAETPEAQDSWTFYRYEHVGGSIEPYRTKLPTKPVPENLLSLALVFRQETLEQPRNPGRILDKFIAQLGVLTDGDVAHWHSQSLKLIGECVFILGTFQSALSSPPAMPGLLKQCWELGRDTLRSGVLENWDRFPPSSQINGLEAELLFESVSGSCSIAWNDEKLSKTLPEYLAIPFLSIRAAHSRTQQAKESERVQLLKKLLSPLMIYDYNPLKKRIASLTRSGINEAELKRGGIALFGRSKSDMRLFYNYLLVALMSYPKLELSEAASMVFSMLETDLKRESIPVHDFLEKSITCSLDLLKSMAERSLPRWVIYPEECSIDSLTNIQELYRELRVVRAFSKTLTDLSPEETPPNSALAIAYTPSFFQKIPGSIKVEGSLRVGSLILPLEMRVQFMHLLDLGSGETSENCSLRSVGYFGTRDQLMGRIQDKVPSVTSLPHATSGYFDTPQGAFLSTIYDPAALFPLINNEIQTHTTNAQPENRISQADFAVLAAATDTNIDILARLEPQPNEHGVQIIESLNQPVKTGHFNPTRWVLNDVHDTTRQRTQSGTHYTAAVPIGDHETLSKMVPAALVHARNQLEEYISSLKMVVSSPSSSKERDLANQHLLLIQAKLNTLQGELQGADTERAAMQNVLALLSLIAA